MRVLDGTQPVKVQSPPIGPSCTSSGRAPAAGRRPGGRHAARPPAHDDEIPFPFHGGGNAARGVPLRAAIRPGHRSATSRW